MSKSPLISEKALERQHTIRGVCKREPVTAKDYAEYQQDKKEGIMNTLIKIAPNFKKLMDSYILSKAFNTHENCIKHVIKPFVKNELCPGDVPENREIITKHIGRLIEGLEKANKAEEERIALSLESYLTQLVSTKYGTFTGGRKRRRTRRRKKRRKKTKKRRRKRKKRGATKKRKHPEGSQDEPSSSRPRSRRMRNEFERGQQLRDNRRNFNNRHSAIRARTMAMRVGWREAHHITIEDLEILIHDIIKLRNEMQEFIRKYDFDAPLYGDPNFPHDARRGELSFVRDILLEDLNYRILSLERLMRRLEDAEQD